MYESYRPKRGEVYYIRYDNSIGSEQSVGRPAVVISSDKGNETCNTFNCLFMTTAPKSLGINIPIESTSRKSWVLCNQINTFDIRRFGDKMCTLPPKEMAAVEAGLALALGLDISDHSAEDEVAELKAKLKELDDNCRKMLRQMEQKHEKELADVRLERQVERDLSEKKYQKALEMLAERHIERDLVAEEPKQEIPFADEPTLEPQKVNINTCTERDLKNLGFKPCVAAMIVASRPFKNVDALRAVPGMTRVAFQIVEKKITVGEPTVFVATTKKPKSEKPTSVPSGRVNVNTATWKEIVAGSGIGETTAKNITRYRNKHGLFSSLEELTNVPRFGKQCLKKYSDKLAV